MPVLTLSAQVPRTALPGAQVTLLLWEHLWGKVSHGMAAPCVTQQRKVMVGVIVAARKYAAEKTPLLVYLKGASPLEDKCKNLVLNSPLYLLEYPSLYFFVNVCS